MKLYNSKENTPLAFYKFFMYVFLPLGAVGCVYSLISFIFIGNLNSFYAAWYRETLIVQGILVLILYGFMFFGMLKWKKYTIVLFIVLLGFCCVSSAISIINSIASPIVLPNYSRMPNYQLPADFASLMQTITQVAVVFGAVVNVGLYILMFLYFYKRKLLFDGVPYKISPKNEQPNPPQYYHYPTQSCPNCGTIRPSPEYRFCPECGKEYSDK